MSARNVKLKGPAVQKLINWISRDDAAERFEVSAQQDQAGNLQKLARSGVPITWEGAGAKGLKLEGLAEADQAALVLVHGKGPAGEKLRTDVAADGEQGRVSAFGIVYSAPKTVSLLLSHHDPSVRRRAIDAFRRASDQYLQTLESQLTVRRGAGGTQSEKIAGLISVRAQHMTTSSGDPHLHAHWVVAASAASAIDGKYRALDGNVMFQAQKLAESRANSVLKQTLERVLGIQNWVMKEVGSAPTWEIGALLPATENLSQARDHMKAVAASMGVPFQLRSRQMDAHVWRRHRERKAEIAEILEHRLDEALTSGGSEDKAIRATWREAIYSAGCASELQAIKPALSPAPPVLPDLGQLDADQVLRDLTAVLGTYTPHDVAARLVVTHGLQVATAQRVAAVLLRYWHEQGHIHLRAGLDIEVICRVLEGGGFSPRTSDLKQAMRAQAIVPDLLVRQEVALAETARELSETRRMPILVPLPEEYAPEQRRAAATIAQGRALTVTTGVAGAGKTTLARPIVQAAKQQGFNVLVLARNRSLAESLRRDLGCRYADTFASFCRRELPGKTLVIVDEAGLGDREDLIAVLQAVEQNSQCQAWLIGDRAQAQPIDRLAAFATIEQAVVPEARSELKTSYRCKAWAEEHDLLRAVSDETAAELVARIDRSRHLVGSDPDSAEDRYAQLAALADRYRQAGEDPLVICRSNADAAAAAEYMQAHRQITVDLTTRLRFDQRCGIGDQVRTRRNDARLGVVNGDRWTVVATDQGGVTLRSEQSTRVVHLPVSYTHEWLELGYAATADSAQGITVDRAIVDTTGMGRSVLYSAATRGRQEPVYVVTAEFGKEVEALTQVLCRDDAAQTMRELLRGRPAERPQPRPSSDPGQEPARIQRTPRPEPVPPMPGINPRDVQIPVRERPATENIPLPTNPAMAPSTPGPMRNQPASPAQTLPEPENDEDFNDGPSWS